MTNVAVSERNGIALIEELGRAGGLFVNSNGDPIGLSLPPGLPYERFEAVLVASWRCHELSRWIVGDCIAYGEDTYKDDIYMQAVSLTGLSKNTLENYASASRLVPPQRRRAGVSHSVHVEVKSLDGNQQRQLLAKAEREGLTKEAVRELVREAKGRPEPEERPVCGECGRPL